MHLTLRFLGDIEESVGHAILNAAAEVAETIPPFRVSARGLGCFPGPHKPSVVWLGVHAEGDGLFRLQKAVESAARTAGLERERRSFKPHLTLGRIKPPASTLSWTDLAAAHASFDVGAWMVRDVALFASELHPAGARYTRLAAVSLGNTSLGNTGLGKTSLGNDSLGTAE